MTWHLDFWKTWLESCAWRVLFLLFSFYVLLYKINKLNCILKYRYCPFLLKFNDDVYSIQNAAWVNILTIDPLSITYPLQPRSKIVVLYIYIYRPTFNSYFSFMIQHFSNLFSFYSESKTDHKLIEWFSRFTKYRIIGVFISTLYKYLFCLCKLIITILEKVITTKLCIDLANVITLGCVHSL